MRRRRAPLKACIRCKALSPPYTQVCPNCGSRDFSEEWEGMVIIFDIEKSEVAKKLNISQPGRYAIKVRA